MRMKPFTSHTLALALCCALASTGWAQTAKPGQPIVLNFVNADIEAVARTLAGLTGRNLVVDPRVKGTHQPEHRAACVAQRSLGPVFGHPAFARLQHGREQWLV
jgi:type II secretory pathway component GspD/PulD (secretin)